MSECSVEGCGKTVEARGWCANHYMRWRRHGEPTGGGPTKTRGATCSLDGCETPRLGGGRGLCCMHYERLRRLGHPGSPGKLPRTGAHHPGYKGGRTLLSSGYIRVSQPGQKMIFEHRLVMASLLGRELLPGENVHHINGDRADNRPENLELWSTSQPAGQRVADKMAWAWQMVELYGQTYPRPLLSSDTPQESQET